MALEWIKVAVDFAHHPKAIALEIRLGDSRAILHLPAIWAFYALHFADGAMPDTPGHRVALERAALWNGTPGALIDAYVEAGLLDQESRDCRATVAGPSQDGRADVAAQILVVHDWDEWQEAHTTKLTRDRDRMRAKRAKERDLRRATVARPSQDRRALEERRGEERRPEEEEAALRARDDDTAPPTDTSDHTDPVVGLPPTLEAPLPLALRYPLAERFRVLVSNGLGGMQNGGYGLRLPEEQECAALECELSATTVERAATHVVETVRERHVSPKSLRYVLGIVHDYVTQAPRAPGAVVPIKKPRITIGLDRYTGKPIYEDDSPEVKANLNT